jgi:hypothetical protein
LTRECISIQIRITVARSYDAAGNTTARGNESLFYVDHNRLVSWSGSFGMSSASYQHNARGERVWKTSVIGTASMIGEEVPPNCLPVEGQSVQTFLYDEAGLLIRDQSDPCAARPTNFEFVWLDHQPLAVIDADPNLPAPQFVGHITSDHLHTPRAISNASGNVTWTWAPSPATQSAAGEWIQGETALERGTLNVIGSRSDQELPLRSHPGAVRDREDPALRFNRSGGQQKARAAR